MDEGFLNEFVTAPHEVGLEGSVSRPTVQSMATENDADKVYGDGTLPEDADLTASHAETADPVEADIDSRNPDTDDQVAGEVVLDGDEAREEADRDRAERHD